MTDGGRARVSILTLNPSLDVAYEVAKLVPDEKVHARHFRYDPGGNGINVHHGLKKLGIDAQNFCIVAGEIGHMVQRIAGYHPDAIHFIQAEGETRISCAIIEDHHHCQYEMVGIGPAIDAATLAEIERRFVDSCEDGDFAVITGSVPPCVPEDTYARLTEKLCARGVPVIVDASGVMLADAVTKKPFLIKPNRHELEMLCGRRLPEIADVVREARTLHGSGITYVCVSLGGEGAVLVGPEASYLARPPRITARSTVGAGDSMVAGLTAALVEGRDAAHALRLGLACGSGTASKPGTELFDPENIQDVIDGITVERLEG